MVKSHFFCKGRQWFNRGSKLPGSILTQVAIINILKLGDAGLSPALCQEAKK